MPLHPYIVAALRAAEGMARVETLGIAEARAQVKAGYAQPTRPVPIAKVEDRRIPGPSKDIGIRLYTPHGRGPLPLLVFFHGSGFVLLDLDSHDAICRELCAGARCKVVSVDYRLAPEHKFPAANDDCLAAIRWAAAHAAELGIDPKRIAVAGDSAGGCLAAMTALALRDEGGPRLCAQLLFYPVTAYYAPAFSSHREFESGYGLTFSTLKWYWDQYLSDASDAERAAPLAARSLAGLPPALVLTAEYDVLRDEGEHYVKRLRDAHVQAELRRCDGMNHGFLKWVGTIDEAGRAMDEACAWLRGIYALNQEERAE